MVCGKIFVMAALVAVACAAPRPESVPYGHPPPSYKEPGMPFEFAYAVKDDYSGNDFAHDEKSDGTVTSGSYRVLLPDGRTQIVTFTADHTNGYVAEVTYEGEASYPAPAHPSYGPPSPPAYGPPPPPAYGPPAPPAYGPPPPPAYGPPAPPAYEPTTTPASE